MLVASRIDDRLVHGQVVIGWGRPLEISRIALVDADVAASELERDLYRMAVPDGIALEFLTPDEAPPRVAALAAGDERVMILTGSVAAMIRLAKACPAIRTINLGGVHDGPGRREYLRYVYLTPAELADLGAVQASGVEVSAQDVPTAPPIAFAEIERA